MTIMVMEGCDLALTNTDVEATGAYIHRGSIGVGINRDSDGGVFILDGQSTSMVSWLLPFVRYTTVSFWMYIDSASIEVLMNICEISDSSAPSALSTGTTQHASFRLNLNGGFSVYGDSINRGESIPGIITPQTWHHIECQFDNNASGTCVFVVDGVEILRATGDFIDGGVNSSVLLYAAAARVFVDDIVIQQDASVQPPLLGRHKIETLLPTGAGNTSDFTGTFADIDDTLNTHDGDTTTITSDVLNAKSDFAMGDIAGSVGTVHAVKPITQFKKSDSGVTGITNYIRSGTTDYSDSTELVSTEIYQSRIGDIREVDPDTATAWTEAGVNAAQLGIEITT